MWSQQAKLTASDAAASDFFGGSVAVSGDTAVIGAVWDDDGGTNSGSAYVFTRTGGVWSQQAKLTASDPAESDQFGSSVAVNGDTAVIGAILDDDGGTSSGSAYVFTRTGGVWSQQAKLTASDADAEDWFGISVAISGDTVLIGAWLDDDGGINSGSAYVFTRSGGGWSQQAKLTASDTATFDNFGISVAVSGNTAVIGARFDDDGDNDSGSAYVFTRTDGVWSEQAKLTASDAAVDDEFGFSVAVSGDTAIIGAWRNDDGGNDSGSAYVFDLSYPLAVATSGTGSGNIVSHPSGIDCGLTCEASFVISTTVTLTATADLGSTFTGWSGDVVTTTNPITVTMDSAKAITATFVLNEYELTTATTGNGAGNITPAGGTYTHGTIVTLTATADLGSTFTGWSGDVLTTTNPITITMDSAKAITATFALNQYGLNVATVGNGTAVPSSGTYDYGTVVTLTATADTGSTFFDWNGDIVTTTNPITITMDSNKFITATFALNQYTITLSAEPAEGGTVTGGGSVTHGQMVTATATAETGYTFLHWVEGGDVVSTAASYSFTATAERALVAHFAASAPKIYLPLVMR